jgi:hypothetical protein
MENVQIFLFLLNKICVIVPMPQTDFHYRIFAVEPSSKILKSSNLLIC